MDRLRIEWEKIKSPEHLERDVKYLQENFSKKWQLKDGDIASFMKIDLVPAIPFTHITN